MADSTSTTNPAIMKTYVICSTQRSGSSMLCGLLRQTGSLGKPGETIAYSKLKKIAKDRGESDLVEVANDVLAELSSESGVTGVKLHYHQLIELVEKVGFSSLFKDAYWIYIDRKNIIEQAVSLAKAWQTREFSSKHVKTAEARYSFEEISKSGKFLIREKASWEWFFSALNISPLRVTYEDILENENFEVQRVCDLIGATPKKPVSSASLSIKQQRTAENTEWVKRLSIDFRHSLEPTSAANNKS